VRQKQTRIMTTAKKKRRKGRRKMKVMKAP
jgi:hypothetical protein